MSIGVKVLPGLSSIILSTIALIISVLILGTGIYLIYLLVKALKLYIKKNS